MRVLNGDNLLNKYNVIYIAQVDDFIKTSFFLILLFCHFKFIPPPVFKPPLYFYFLFHSRDIKSRHTQKIHFCAICDVYMLIILKHYKCVRMTWSHTLTKRFLTIFFYFNFFRETQTRVIVIYICIDRVNIANWKHFLDSVPDHVYHATET